MLKKPGQDIQLRTEGHFDTADRSGAIGLHGRDNGHWKIDAFDIDVIRILLVDTVHVLVEQRDAVKVVIARIPFEGQVELV